MLFINRELSWLDFNARVLNEAADERNPLLERLKFASIFSSNLDEFFMVRVAGLRRQLAATVVQAPPDRLTAQEQLDAIFRRVAELVREHGRLLHEVLLPALGARGVRLVGVPELSPTEWVAIDEFFAAQVFPVLTPLAVDPGHPFPYISNLSLSLAVEIRDPDTDDVHFARVKVPKSLPRWVPISRPNHFVPLEQVIGANLGVLFPGMEVVGWHTFRVTRYSDLDLGSLEEPDDLLAMIEEQVFRRRFAEVVRLEVADGTPRHLVDLILEALREEEREEDETGPVALLTERDIQVVGPMLDLADLMVIAMLDIADLRDPPLVPIVPEELRDQDRSIFDVIRERDVLVHHPFESFSASIERFLDAASTDEHVLAIKMTLYRTSGDTAIVRALTHAAQRGKQVAVLVELQARFDEANNINWARTLENFGVHVAYGMASLKTHTKTALVVRREPDGIRRYVHIGTGNYNSKTARVYTDIGLLTANPAVGADVSDLFNMLTGFSRQRRYRKLIVAPANMRERVLELIAREAARARDGRGGRIIAKMNSLVDAATITALYEASQAGVEIDLIIRGICCLRPGVEGVSERIRVISIVGRFLEHSRLWSFGNAGAEEVFIGSADWMPRNFDRRVEVMVPVEGASLHARLRSLLGTCLMDNRQAWDLHADGSWHQRVPTGVERATHRILIADAWGLSRTSMDAAAAAGAKLQPVG